MNRPSSILLKSRTSSYYKKQKKNYRCFPSQLSEEEKSKASEKPPGGWLWETSVLERLCGSRAPRIDGWAEILLFHAINRHAMLIFRYSSLSFNA